MSNEAIIVENPALRGEEFKPSAEKTATHLSQSADLSPVRRNFQTWTASDLIRLAATSPPQPIIEGLLNVGDIMLLHGTEESVHCEGHSIP